MPWVVQIDNCKDAQEHRPYVLRVFDTERRAREYAVNYQKCGYRCHVWCMDSR